MDSFISRIGGKKLLRKEILKKFPEERPSRYIEPFGGAGWILFASDSHADIEIFNDIDGQLINLFRCVKYHCDELQQELRWVLNSRQMFEDARKLQSFDALTDIQRAAQHFIVIKESFGSDGRTYGALKKSLFRSIDYLYEIHKRLQDVVIEHKDFESLIKLYDTEDALFYLDPPYHGTEKYYNFDFTERDHTRLNEVLKGLKGKFILSYNDDDYIRDLYKGFIISTVQRNNNMSKKAGAPLYKELLIQNY